MKNLEDCIPTCQAIQLATMDILGDLTGNPDLVNVPAYKELTERMYLAARQAATVARIMGDNRTATFTDSICDKIVRLADL